MKKCVVLAILAGSCAAAVAQPIEVAPEPINPQWHRVNADGSITPIDYGSRADGVVFNNGLFGGSGAAGTSLGAPAALPAGTPNHHQMVRISWAPGPWATQVAHNITGWSMILSHPVTGTDIAGAYYRAEFYEISDVSLDGFTGVGTSMIEAGAVPAATVELAIPQGVVRSGSGNGWVYGPFAGPNVPSGEYFVAVSLRDAADALIPAGNDAYRMWVGKTQNSTTNPCEGAGTTNNNVAFDRNVDGTFIGALAPGGATLERTHYTIGGFAIAPVFSITGDVQATAPVCGTEAENFTLGADNAFASDTTAIAANGVKVYCVTITSDAIDENYGYINFDTEGSDNAFALGLYNSQGALVASNDGAGSGVLGSNSQLSFGMGRFAPAGPNGREYDGRNWDDTGAVIRGLAAGTYYLYVVPSDGAAPTFAPGFTVSGTGAGGNAVVRIRTNATNLTAPPPADAPVSTHLIGQGSEDPIVAPGAISAGTVMAGNTPLWYSVNLCRDSDASGNSVTFSSDDAADFATFGIYVFNSGGNLVGQANSTGGTATLAFTDAPVLPAGLYYVGVTYNGGGAQGDVAPDAANNGRWHLRGRNMSNGFNITTSVLVNWLDCAAPCDGDVNCDFALDGFDVEVQEKAVGGDTTDYCQPDPDFNGDFALDGFDVEAVEIVVGGGPCP